MSLENIKTIVEVTDKGNQVIKLISAAEAFRKYKWLKEIPLTNISGNLRGMVINAKARSVYNFTSKVENQKYLESIGILISWAQECQRSSASFERIFMSKDNNLIKAAKISAQISGIATRVLLSLGTDLVHAELFVVKYSNKLIFRSKKIDEKIKSEEAGLNFITTQWANFTTSDGLYNFVQISF